MDSAKIKKSSLDSIFQDLEVAKSLEKIEGEGSPPFSMSSQEATLFSISANVLDNLEKDPAYQKKIRKEVDLQLKKELGEKAEEYFKVECKKGFEQGYSEGKKKAEDDLKEAREKVESLIAHLLQEKVTLLFSHEKIWSEMLLSLSKKLMVGKPEEKVFAIKDWVIAQIEKVRLSGSIVVKLNSNDHLLLTPYFNIEGMKNWKILPDESLKPGEVSCEMDGVGIHFSPELAIQEVERILNTKPGQP